MFKGVTPVRNFQPIKRRNPVTDVIVWFRDSEHPAIEIDWFLLGYKNMDSARGSYENRIAQLGLTGRIGVSNNSEQHLFLFKRGGD